MNQQVGLKVQLASDFGKLSPVGLGVVVKLSNRVEELEKENDRLREALSGISGLRGYYQNDVVKAIADKALEETK